MNNFFRQESPAKFQTGSQLNNSINTPVSEKQNYTYKTNSSNYNMDATRQLNSSSKIALFEVQQYKTNPRQNEPELSAQPIQEPELQTKVFRQLIKRVKKIVFN